MSAIEDAQQIIDYISAKIDVLTPHEISDLTIKLAIGFGNLGQELAWAEAEFAREWLRVKKDCKTNSEADHRARATDAFFQKKKLEYVVRGIKEIIHALKKRQLVLSDEAKLQY